MQNVFLGDPKEGKEEVQFFEVPDIKERNIIENVLSFFGIIFITAKFRLHHIGSGTLAKPPKTKGTTSRLPVDLLKY